MKPAQLRLRLFLLLVTLLATVFAWRGALRSERQAGRVYHQSTLEAERRKLERICKLIQNPATPKSGFIWVSQREVVQLKKQLSPKTFDQLRKLTSVAPMQIEFRQDDILLVVCLPDEVPEERFRVRGDDGLPSVIEAAADRIWHYFIK